MAFVAAVGEEDVGVAGGAEFGDFDLVDAGISKLLGVGLLQIQVGVAGAGAGREKKVEISMVA